MQMLGVHFGPRDPDDDMDPDERDDLLKSMVADSLAYAQGKEPEEPKSSDSDGPNREGQA